MLSSNALIRIIHSLPWSQCHWKSSPVIIVTYQLLRSSASLTQIQPYPVVHNTPMQWSLVISCGQQTTCWNDNDDEDGNSNAKVWCISPHCTYQTHSLRSSFTLRGVRHFPSSANISSHATSPTLSKEVNISLQPASDTHTDCLPEKSTINGVMRLLLGMCASSLHNSLPMSNIQTFPHHHLIRCSGLVAHFRW